MKTVGIIGLGLIGGSMAIDLRRRRFAEELIGVDSEPANAAAAVRIGLVDEIVSFEECVRRSDLIVLAVPVGTAAGMLPGILDRFAVSEDGARKIVIDVCSEGGSCQGCQGTSDAFPLCVYPSDGRNGIFWPLGSRAWAF